MLFILPNIPFLQSFFTEMEEMILLKLIDHVFTWLLFFSYFLFYLSFCVSEEVFYYSFLYNRFVYSIKLFENLNYLYYFVLFVPKHKCDTSLHISDISIPKVKTQIITTQITLHKPDLVCNVQKIFLINLYLQRNFQKYFILRYIIFHNLDWKVPFKSSSSEQNITTQG